MNPVFDGRSDTCAGGRRVLCGDDGGECGGDCFDPGGFESVAVVESVGDQLQGSVEDFPVTVLVRGMLRDEFGGGELFCGPQFSHVEGVDGVGGELAESGDGGADVVESVDDRGHSPERVGEEVCEPFPSFGGKAGRGGGGEGPGTDPVDDVWEGAVGVVQFVEQSVCCHVGQSNRVTSNEACDVQVGRFAASVAPERRGARTAAGEGSTLNGPWASIRSRA